MAQIWVDADACPGVVREILFRAAERTATMVTLIANQPSRVPPSRYIQAVQVGAGFDVADDAIVQRCHSGDLIITSDIPLAAAVIAKGATALSARGERFTRANIRAKLNMRDFMDTMRGSGLHTAGPPPLRQTDRKAFADQLDRWLTGEASGRRC